MHKSAIVYYKDRAEEIDILAVIQNVPQDMLTPTIIQWYAKKYGFYEENLYVVKVDGVEYVP